MGNGRDANIRIGSVERERAVAALGEHLSEGRLEVTEYDQRCAQAAAARTRGDLDALFEDLPAPRPDFGPARPPIPQPVPEAALSSLVEKAPSRDNTKAVIVGLVVFAVVAVVAVVALTQTWWALVPAFLIVVLFAMFS